MTTIPLAPARGAHRLDDGQLAVVELPVGASAVVLGAPGSGKTTAAVELVAHRVLGDGFAPDEVLVLAPRRLQAARLRDRLLLRVDRPATGPLARTTASLAFDIARRSAVAEGRPAPALLTGNEQDALIAQLLAETGAGWPERLGPLVRGLQGFRSELRELLARATERGVDMDELRRIGRERGRDEWVAAADFFDEYLEVLTAVQPDSFDSAELVALAAGAVDRGTAGEVADRLRLIVVDDLQDATESTVALLAAFAGRRVPIVGLGDPDVAADTFRGGEPELLGRFQERLGLPDARRVVLPTVHRHAPAVRDLVRAVSERIGTALAGGQRKAVSSPEAPAGRVLAVVAGSAPEQAAGLAQLLRRRHLVEGIGWGDAAVVVRTGALAEPLAQALTRGGVPAHTRATGRPLREDPAARALLSVDATALGLTPLTPETAVELVTGPFGGLDRLALRRLRLALRAEELAGGGVRSAGALLVEALAAPNRLVTIDAPFARRAERLATSMAQVRERAATGDSVEELLWLVWERSRLAGTWRSEAMGAGTAAAEASRNLDGVVALFTAAARSVEQNPADPPGVFLTAQLGAEVPDDNLTPRSVEDSVLVTTPAGVAGLEFDTVVVAGLQEGVWPNLRPRGSLLGAGTFARLFGAGDAPVSVADERRSALSDELRLFALAASRARSLLVLSAVSNDEEAPSVLARLGGDPSPIGSDLGAPHSLRPLVGRLRRILVTGGGEERREAASALARLAAAQVPGAHPAAWHGLLSASTTAPLVVDPEQPVPVSPSAIEAFERSGVDWFLDRVAGGESQISSAIGTLLHWVLETATAPDEAVLLAALEGRWGELDFEADWIAARERRLADRMACSIGAYLADRRRAGAELLGGEQGFTFRSGRAEVRGKIDRLERERGGGVVVVDLKTNKPSRQVKQKDAGTHPQLGAYQLAVLEGAVAGATGALSGARLLYVQTASQKAYSLVEQAALDDAAAAAFRARLAEAAEGMAAASWDGPLEAEERFGAPSLRFALPRIAEVCGD